MRLRRSPGPLHDLGRCHERHPLVGTVDEGDQLCGGVRGLLAAVALNLNLPTCLAGRVQTLSLGDLRHERAATMCRDSHSFWRLAFASADGGATMSMGNALPHTIPHPALFLFRTPPSAETTPLRALCVRIVRMIQSIAGTPRRPDAPSCGPPTCSRRGDRRLVGSAGLGS